MSRQIYTGPIEYVDPDSGNLRPAVGAQITVFKAGTETLATLYETRSGGSPIANPLIVSATDGMAIFWAESGDYDLAFHDTIVAPRFGDYKIGWQSCPVDTEIEAADLSNAGDIEWTQEVSGAWVPTIKSGAIGTSELASSAVTESKIAAGAVGLAQLAAASKRFTWYTPKIIATEESRTNTAYGPLTTADEITGIVVPENALIVVGFTANVKCSVAEAGRVALFLNSNQLKIHATGPTPISQEVEALQTTFRQVSSYPGGLRKAPNESAAYVTTGQALGDPEGAGPVWVFAAAGTYNIGVQFKASSGSITAKERKLWVAVIGS